jgi:hypothetical protein
LNLPSLHRLSPCESPKKQPPPERLDSPTRGGPLALSEFRFSFLKSRQKEESNLWAVAFCHCLLPASIFLQVLLQFQKITSCNPHWGNTIQVSACAYQLMCAPWASTYRA